MDKTLVIMAAGMGSRYGGDKQIDGMGPNNEALMLYSIFDAVKAGFNKVVFIIKHSFEDKFKAQIGDVVANKVHVEYAYQEIDDLPPGCTVNPERTKPLGTVHALLSAKGLINEPFAVINADDYYGVPAYATMIRHLETLRDEKHACMVGYYLKNTVSENGHVTRGVCATDENNQLVSVTETYKIQVFPDGTIRDTEKDPAGVLLDPECLVSMNFFGFTPWFLERAEEYFVRFLQGLSVDEMKAEFVLPVLVDKLMKEEDLKVDMLTTDAVWFGVTYKEDKPYVQGELKKMHDAGIYPEQLF